MKNKNNIVIIGNPGAGKSLLGIELSKKINKKFFDSDNEIEKLFNDSIKNIFKNYGEKFFRKEENNMIKKFINYENIILSTGGGVILLKENRNILKEIGIIIYIKTSIEKCIQRIINSDRPIIYKNKFNKDKIFNILKNRENIYETICNIKIDTNKKNICEIIEDIIYTLKINEKLKNENN